MSIAPSRNPSFSSIILIAAFALLAYAVGTAALRTTYTAPSGRVSLPGLNLLSPPSPLLKLNLRRALPSSAESDATFARALSKPGLRSLSLTAADFDEDGVPDLACGYGGSSGGSVVVYRGNVDAIYPNTEEAKERRAEGRFTDSPFLHIWDLSETNAPADFLGAGDFDGDFHQDLAVASRGEDSLLFLFGDGTGRLTRTESVRLPGVATALVIGEINRRDGRPDVAVAVSGRQGASVLVFSSFEGASKASPEAFDLPVEAAALALGNLDGDYWRDVAVAAGRELMVLHGRAGLSLQSSRKNKQVVADLVEAEDVRISRREFVSPVRSLVVGDFTGSGVHEIGVLTEDGAVRVLSRGRGEDGSARKGMAIEEWVEQEAGRGQWREGAGLVAARVANVPVESLIVRDGAGGRLHVLAGVAKTGGTELETESVSAAYEIGEEVVGVLTMRLNGDGLSDLVMLSAGGPEPVAVVTAPQSTFVVMNTNDSGEGSLRDAIERANASLGADEIRFSIAGSGVPTINLTSALPTITDAVLLNGSTQPSGRVALPLAFDLNVHGSNCVFRNLILPSIILSRQSNGNRIEGCLVGTDISGSNGFTGTGVFVSTNDNTIGGTTPEARNITTALCIFGNSNIIQGNTTLSPNGTPLQGDGATGIIIQFRATSCDIGGTTPNMGNIISGSFAGIILSCETNDILVQNNKAGTDAAGTSNLGNSREGIHIQGKGSTVTDNVIAFNTRHGIFLDYQFGFNSQNLILRNSIYSNGGLGIELLQLANNDQNPPAITSVSEATRTIQGTILGRPNTEYLVELFDNTECDPSGLGEGKIRLGSVTFRTLSNGVGTFTFQSSTAITRNITATATDALGNTSEFSGCFGAARQGADLSVEMVTHIGSTFKGNQSVYEIKVSNQGPATATGVTLTGSTPAGTVFFSLEGDRGVTTARPAVEGSGQFVHSIGTLPPGGIAKLRLKLLVTSTDNRTFIENTVSVSGTSSDPILTNNQDSTLEEVDASPGLDLIILMTSPSSGVRAGAQVRYDITVKLIGSMFQQVGIFNVMPAGATLAQVIAPPGSIIKAPPIGSNGTIEIGPISLSAGPERTASISLIYNVISVPSTGLTNSVSGFLIPFVDTDECLGCGAGVPLGRPSTDKNPDDNLANLTLPPLPVPGPTINSGGLKVSSKIKASGSGFLDGVQVFIDGVGFRKRAKVSNGGANLVQKGTLTDGRTILQATPVGRAVIISFQNPDGGTSTVAFTRR